MFRKLTGPAIVCMAAASAFLFGAVFALTNLRTDKPEAAIFEGVTYGVSANQQPTGAEFKACKVINGVVYSPDAPTCCKAECKCSPCECCKACK